MVDLVVTKPKGGAPRLLPATALDLEQLEKLKPDRPAFAKVVFKRSLPHLRWYRGLCSAVADGLGISPDLLHAELKFKAGMVRRILSSQAYGVAVELESVAFATMDESKFAEFTRLAIEIIFRDYLPGVRRRDVFARVEEMVGPRPK